MNPTVVAAEARWPTSGVPVVKDRVQATGGIWQTTGWTCLCQLELLLSVGAARFGECQHSNTFYEQDRLKT